MSTSAVCTVRLPYSTYTQLYTPFTVMLKRSIDDEEEGRELIEVTAAIAGKKMRSEYSSGYQMVAHHGEASQDLVAAGRTSSLPAPEITLLGHDNAIYSIAFSSNGEQLCSGSLDRQICEISTAQC